MRHLCWILPALLGLALMLYASYYTDQPMNHLHQHRAFLALLLFVIAAPMFLFGKQPEAPRTKDAQEIWLENAEKHIGYKLTRHKAARGPSQLKIGE